MLVIMKVDQYEGEGIFLPDSLQKFDIKPGRTVTLVRGFVNNFLRVHLAFLGSRVAAEQLWSSQKIVNKTPCPCKSPAW